MRKIISYYLFPVLYGLLLIWAFLPYYQGGSVILGQEGNNFLDFSNYLHNFRLTWQTTYGTGFFNQSVNSSFPNIYLLTMLQNLINNPQVLNFTLVFLIYFLPFLAIYKLCKELEVEPFVSFLVSLFYVVNPFTFYFFFSNLNHWNLFILLTFPTSFWIILKFFRYNLRLFFYYGLISLLFAFVYVNPPMIVVNQIGVVISLLIVYFYRYSDVSFIQVIKKYLLLLASFIILNFWWIIIWLYNFLDLQKGYTKEFAISWLRGSGKFIPALWRILNLTCFLSYPLDPTENSLFQHYSYFFTPIILAIPLIIIIYFLFRKKLWEKYQTVLLLFLLIMVFLSKGVRGLWGGFYEFLIMNLPLFSIFKTATEKWGVLFIFLLTLTLIFIFKEIKKDKNRRFILALFAFYLLYASWPLLIRNPLPDSRIRGPVVSSKKFLDKPEYQDLRVKLTQDKEQYRVLSLPGSLNYQVALQIQGKKLYTGLDPVLYGLNKAFLAPYNGSYNQRFPILFDSIAEPNYLNLLRFFNIKKIVINKDIFPWYGTREKESVPEIEAILDKKLPSFKNGAIDLYDLTDYYLPRFYIPERIIYSPESTQKDLPSLISFRSFSPRTAVFFDLNNVEEKRRENEENFVKDKSSQTLLVGQIRSAVDEAKLRTGVEGINPAGVLFPYARWKPGTLVYPYIQKKEEKAKEQVSMDTKLSLEKHLFYAAKRISELQKWNQSFTDNEFAEIMGRYQAEMEEAIKDMLNVKGEIKGEDDGSTLLVKLEVSFGAHFSRLLDVLLGDNAGQARIESANSVFKKINKQLRNIIEENFSLTTYKFQIPREGKYEILAERPYPSSDWKIENITQNASDKFTVSVSEQQEEENWVSFGRKSFNQGEHILAFQKPAAENLLTSDWQRAGGGKAEFGEATITQEVAYQEIKNWQPERRYKLSFKYRTERGQLRVILTEGIKTPETKWLEKGIEERITDQSRTLLDNTVESEGEWETFQAVVESGKNTDAATLYIGPSSQSKDFSIGQIKEPRLELVIEPRIILKNLGEKSSPPVPKMTFKRINATKYVVEIQEAVDPYFLVFSESYHSGWKAYVEEASPENEDKIIASFFDGQIREGEAKDVFWDWMAFKKWGKKPLPEDQHLFMNGYANSWYLTPQDAGGRKNYRIIIEYPPQRLFYLGVLFSALTILIILFYGLIKRIKPKN